MSQVGGNAVNFIGKMQIKMNIKENEMESEKIWKEWKEEI